MAIFNNYTFDLTALEFALRRVKHSSSEEEMLARFKKAKEYFDEFPTIPIDRESIFRLYDAFKNTPEMQIIMTYQKRFYNAFYSINFSHFSEMESNILISLSENRDRVFERAFNQIQQDFPTHTRVPNHRFDILQRWRRLLETPLTDEFPPLQVMRRGQNIGIVGQEALIQQRPEIETAFQEIIKNPQTQQAIEKISNLSTQEQKLQFTLMATHIRKWMHHKKKLKSSAQELFEFRLNTAERGLQLLEGNNIEHHPASLKELYQTYQYPNMPNIIQLYLMIFNNTKKDPLEFIKAWLIENPNVIKMSQGKETLAYLQDPSSQEEILLWSKAIEGEDESTVPQWKGNAFIHLMQAYWNTQDYIPITEALFITMRGHNHTLENNEEPNFPACAEGAYLNVIKEFSRIFGSPEMISRLQGVEIVNCETT